VVIDRDRKDFFKKAPVSGGFALADLYTFRAGYDNQKGYWVQRVTVFPARYRLAVTEDWTHVGFFEMVPVFWLVEEEMIDVGIPEYLTTIKNENEHYL
jgi:hypothetical protein